MKIASTIVAAALLGSTPALANVVYDESVDGDLALSPGTAIALSEGTNVIVGSVTYTGGDIPDWDSFAVEIPVGHTLTSAILGVTAIEINASDISWNYALHNGILGSEKGTDGSELFPDPGDVAYFEEFMPLAEGVYTFRAFRMSCTHCVGLTSTFSYSWTLNLIGPESEVPEPAALALVGLGLAGLGVARRRARA